MKFAHVRASGHFAFAKQIFHREAISLAHKGKFRCVPAVEQVRMCRFFCLYSEFRVFLRADCNIPLFEEHLNILGINVTKLYSLVYGNSGGKAASLSDS